MTSQVARRLGHSVEMLIKIYAGAFEDEVARGNNLINIEVAATLKPVDFGEAWLGDGYVTFGESQFGCGTVNFIATRFGEGDVNFTEADFGDGDLAIEDANFGNGMVSFAKAKVQRLLSTKYGRADRGLASLDSCAVQKDYGP